MSFGLESKETKKERRLSEVSDEESFNDDKRSIKTFPPLKLQEIETSWVERKFFVLWLKERMIKSGVVAIVTT